MHFRLATRIHGAPPWRRVGGRESRLGRRVMKSDDRRRKGNSLRELAAGWRRLPKEDQLICLWKRMGFNDEAVATTLGRSLSEVRAAYSRAKVLMH